MNIKDIKNWFEVAIPNPTIEQACIQIGCHYEEAAEMASALGDGDEEYQLNRIADIYKSTDEYHVWTMAQLIDISKTELLDSLCDQIVTAIGVAHMLGMDIERALAEVNRSNHSKFEDGKAVFDENGKIAKGKHYSKPELARFVSKGYTDDTNFFDEPMG